MAVYRGVPWRFIFTDLNSATTTWADGLLTSRRITYGLNQPTQIDASVWPNDKRVNLVAPDGYPLIAQSNRIVYCFRRENPPGSTLPPWVCRAAGVIMTPEDSGDTDVPLTNFTAYDSWKYLGGRPVVDIVGALPGPNGYFLPAATGNTIATTILFNTIQAEIANSSFPAGLFGNGTGVDAGDGSRSGEGSQYADWGGTSFYQGTIEVTCPINLVMQQGSSVADVWTQLCDSGNLDIVLEPIYDPINRPGYTHELNIYNLAGRNRPDALFAWDMMRRNLKRIDRLHSAVPGDFFNRGQYFSGQGGYAAPPVDNSLSTNVFTSYWSQQFQPSQPNVDPAGNVTYALLQQAVYMAKQGKRTVTMDPIPERSPVPIQDYECGDIVPVWASKNLRVAISDDFTTSPPKAFRVEAIPVDIDDNGIETVSQLLVSPDWRTASIGC